MAEDGLTYASMSDFRANLDIELLYARWVLGGVEPHQLVHLALSALEQGIDGTALQQLAGLTQPTSRDLGTLPTRAFAEMGLKAIGREEAAVALLDRGQPAVLSNLRRAFPNFSERWKKCVANQGAEYAGSYLGMAEFVHFVVEDVYEKRNIDETRRVFQVLEEQLVEADQETTDLVLLGFFETLQNFASWRRGGNRVYEQFLGPISRAIWNELQRMWAGKSSLMDVIRAEQNSNKRDKP
jgi:hypothetical protein